MFGLGTLIRSYLYDLQGALPPPVGGRFHRYVPDYFEYEMLQRHFITSRKHKYLYMVNPKVASNSIRNVLHRLNGGHDTDGPRDVWDSERAGYLKLRDLPRDAFCDIVEAPDYFRFSFVRNPFSRLVSAYVFFHNPARRQSMRGIRPSGRRVMRRRDPRRGGSILHRAITFREFIEDTCCHDDVVHDRHFRPQCDVLLLDRINYDFIGRIESFAADIRRVLERLGAPSEAYADSARVTNASRKTKAVSEWYTPDLAEKVRAKFARDFEAFSYSLDVPRASAPHAA